jgi:redox-sensitive bicupin YhaK (pirin superfamily)
MIHRDQMCATRDGDLLWISSEIVEEIFKEIGGNSMKMIQIWIENWRKKYWKQKKTRKQKRKLMTSAWKISHLCGCQLSSSYVDWICNWKWVVIFTISLDDGSATSQSTRWDKPNSIAIVTNGLVSLERHFLLLLLPLHLSVAGVNLLPTVCARQKWTARVNSDEKRQKILNDFTRWFL